MKLTLDTATDDAQAAKHLIAFLVNYYSIPAGVMPAASAAPAPAAATVAQEQQPPASVQTHDSAGVPYDARIHSGGRSVMKDGTWTRRRGVDDAEYAQVLAEITGKQQPPPIVAGSAPVGGLPSPVVPAAAPSLTWQDVCAVLNSKVMSGAVAPEALNEFARGHGVEPFALIAQRPELYAATHAWLSSK